MRRLTEVEARGAGEVDLRMGDEVAAGVGSDEQRLRIVARGERRRARGGSVGALDPPGRFGDLRLERLRAGALVHEASSGSGGRLGPRGRPGPWRLLGTCDLHLGGDAVIERIDARGDGEVGGRLGSPAAHAVLDDVGGGAVDLQQAAVRVRDVAAIGIDERTLEAAPGGRTESRASRGCASGSTPDRTPAPRGR